MKLDSVFESICCDVETIQGCASKPVPTDTEMRILPNSYPLFNQDQDGGDESELDTKSDSDNEMQQNIDEAFEFEEFYEE